MEQQASGRGDGWDCQVYPAIPCCAQGISLSQAARNFSNKDLEPWKLCAKAELHPKHGSNSAERAIAAGSPCMVLFSSGYGEAHQGPKRVYTSTLCYPEFSSPRLLKFWGATLRAVSVGESNSLGATEGSHLCYSFPISQSWG